MMNESENFFRILRKRNENSWYGAKKLGDLGSEEAVSALMEAIDLDHDADLEEYLSDVINTIVMEDSVSPLTKALEKLKAL
jgi:hypothetical protein